MPYDFSKNIAESPDPVKADVKGKPPSWLQGTLLRNGPGIFSVGDTSYNHWFDGMALMASFTVNDGEVIYRSRYLQGDTYKDNMAAKRIVVSEMGTMAWPHPDRSWVSKSMYFQLRLERYEDMSHDLSEMYTVRKNLGDPFPRAITFLNHTVPDFTDNCGNNFLRYGKDYYATSETNYIRKIDPETLETQAKVDYLKYLAVNLVTSHPHYDKDGNTYNMGTSIVDKGKTKYIIFKVPASSETDKTKATKPALKNVEVICSIPCRSLLNPSYYHSFSMTDNYFIFIEQPFKMDIVKMATAYMRGVNWASCIKFCPDENTLIHLIDRTTGKEVGTKYYTDAMITYHHVNAYEEDGHVIVDVIAYKDSSLYDMFYLSKLTEQLSGSSTDIYTKPNTRRFAIPVQSDKDVPVGEDLVKLKYTTASAVKKEEGKLLCQPEVLCEGLEIPCINYDFNGKKHRFVYLTSVEMSVVSTKIVKFDTETREIVEWSEDNCCVSEPVFVPRPNGETEDDGVILAVVIPLNPGQSGFLLFLDAKSFKEVARAYVNAELFTGMHGFFIPKVN